ncbi:MAG: four helix bundle protein [Candidatus Andersenbacteria bacterium]|nr:four helix bundle protein [bacterium]MDZ4225592.1 four helix bundle protein [Candidatus Andersenbacteria bacterium]
MQNNNAKVKTDLRKRAYLYALAILRLTDQTRNKDYGTEVMMKQLIRSATSIGANIIEAQAGSSKKDFTNFYSHALKSANESKFWLGLLRDSGKVSADAVNPILQETCELANILAASVLTLKGKRSF